MNNLLSFVLIILITVVGISVILFAGLPMIENVKKTAELSDSRNFMQQLDSAIGDVSQEGQGSARKLSSTDGQFVVFSSDNSIEYSQSSEDLTSSIITDGSLTEIRGNDVACYEGEINSDGKSELVMENDMLMISFQKVNVSYNNSRNIVSIRSKLTNKTIVPTNSSIVIDNDYSTVSGTGFSEILRRGVDLPSCTVHFFMNSTLDYDTYYTLYSGSDYVYSKVRNIR